MTTLLVLFSWKLKQRIELSPLDKKHGIFLEKKNLIVEFMKFRFSRCPVYIVHVMSKTAADRIAAARGAGSFPKRVIFREEKCFHSF